MIAEKYLLTIIDEMQIFVFIYIRARPNNGWDYYLDSSRAVAVAYYMQDSSEIINNLFAFFF